MLKSKATGSVERLTSFSNHVDGCLFLFGKNMGKKRIPWNKGKKWSDEIRKKISVARKGCPSPLKGRSCSEETKRKISKANKGKTWVMSKETKMKQALCKTGDKNPNWKGEEVGYSALHTWLQRELGSPSECSHCGSTDRKKYEWANVSRQYKRNINDYIRLCVSCHQTFDNRRGGHKIKEK